MTTPPDGLLDLIAEKSFSGAVQVGDWKAAFGDAHRALGVANTVDTRFAVASGNKAMTALLVMSLVADGTMTLETTARSLLGDDLPLIDDSVTVEHLLAHRSGIGDYLDEETIESIDDYLLTVPPHELTTTSAFLPMLEGHAQVFEPGTRFTYCNGGYMVLALLAERASRGDFHTLVRDRVLSPAGMTRSDFLRSDDLPGDAALGYLSDGRTNVFNLPVLGNGDGGLHTTLADMETFWTSLLAGRIVPDASVEMMLEPRSHDDEEDLRYGLGFYLDLEGPGIQLMGWDAGVSFYSHHDPASGRTWTVMANDSEGAWPLVRHLRSAPVAG